MYLKYLLILTSFLSLNVSAFAVQEFDVSDGSTVSYRMSSSELTRIAIAGEGSAIGKAVAVAMATINTYEAVTAALGAKPYGPWNIAQAAATAAMGFVQVRNILKTEVPSPKGGSSGAANTGGGGGGPRLSNGLFDGGSGIVVIRYKFQN